ncbi:HRDC domain protein [compost metagenome]
MSEQCPTTEDAMRRIKGVGEVKFRNYGQPFLELLRTYAGESDAGAGADAGVDADELAFGFE